MGLLLISREAFRGRQGQGARLWPMMKRSQTHEERGPEEVAAKQDKVLGARTKARTKVRTNL
jgi:hypothetical protein